MPSFSKDLENPLLALISRFLKRKYFVWMRIFFWFRITCHLQECFHRWPYTIWDLWPILDLEHWLYKWKRDSCRHFLREDLVVLFEVRWRLSYVFDGGLSHLKSMKKFCLKNKYKIQKLKVQSFAAALPTFCSASEWKSGRL